MAQKNETALVRQILRWISENGGDGYHVHGSAFQRKGEPDIDAWMPGEIHIKFECKMPGEKPDPLQEHRLEVYQNAGYFADWGVALDEFVRKLEQFRHDKSLDKPHIDDYTSTNRDIQLRGDSEG